MRKSSSKTEKLYFKMERQGNHMAQTVEEILSAAKRAGASDVHITVGIPPKMRVNGKLITMEGERLMPADTMVIAESVMNENQKQRFDEKGEVDMSFAIAGEGRYRVNVYKQRGLPRWHSVWLTLLSRRPRHWVCRLRLSTSIRRKGG